MPIVIIELQKKLNEILFGRTVYEYKEVCQRDSSPDIEVQRI